MCEACGLCYNNCSVINNWWCKYNFEPAHSTFSVKVQIFRGEQLKVNKKWVVVSLTAHFTVSEQNWAGAFCLACEIKLPVMETPSFNKMKY